MIRTSLEPADQVVALIQKCHAKAKGFAPRVFTTIAIDDRKGAKRWLTGKVKSAQEKLGGQIKTD